MILILHRVRVTSTAGSKEGDRVWLSAWLKVDEEETINTWRKEVSVWRKHKDVCTQKYKWKLRCFEWGLDSQVEGTNMEQVEDCGWRNNLRFQFYCCNDWLKSLSESLPYILAYKPTIFGSILKFKLWGSAYTLVMAHSHSQHNSCRSATLTVCVLHTAWTISRSPGLLSLIHIWRCRRRG